MKEEIQERHCVICGKVIPFVSRGGTQKHNRKVVCPPSIPGYRSECYREYCRRKAKPSLRREQMTPAQLKADKKRQQRVNEEVRQAKAKVELWQPVTKYKSPVSDKEQRRIDQDCLERDARRMGLARDPGRSLSREEIDALWNAGEITPIDQIPDRVLSDVDYPGLVQSWCDSGARRWVRG